MLNKALLLIVVLIMSACNTPMQITNTNPSGFNYSYDGTQAGLSGVADKAIADCQNAGKTAILNTATEFKGVYVAHFDCVTNSPKNYY